MRKRILILGALAAVLLTADAAVAQFQSGRTRGSSRISQGRDPRARPTVSPYVNLLRNDSFGLTYYGIVRPQQQFRNDAARLQFDLGELRREAYRIDDPKLDARIKTFRTGHRAEFNSNLQAIPREMNLEIVNRRTASLRPNRPEAFSRLPQSGHRSFYTNYGSYYRSQAAR